MSANKRWCFVIWQFGKSLRSIRDQQWCHWLVLYYWMVVSYLANNLQTGQRRGPMANNFYGANKFICPSQMYNLLSILLSSLLQERTVVYALYLCGSNKWLESFRSNIVEQVVENFSGVWESFGIKNESGVKQSFS